MIRPYVELMRVHKPAGWFFFLWPFVWGISMSAFQHKLPYGEYVLQLLKTIVGSFVMRSSACTINDILDCSFDAAVARTKSRPLPSGRITRRAASIFFLGQAVLGIFFFWTYNDAARRAALMQMFPMLCLYPFLKRVTYWPQAWLGLAINFGFLVAWLSVGEIDASNIYTNAYMLIGLWRCISWTMIYDTIYGCQDRKDDIKAGVWSTALLFGDYIKWALFGFAILLVTMLCSAGYANGHGFPYFLISVGGTSLSLFWQLVSVDVDSSSSCWNVFVHNAYKLGPLVYLGLLVDYVRVMNGN